MFYPSGFQKKVIIPECECSVNLFTGNFERSLWVEIKEREKFVKKLHNAAPITINEPGYVYIYLSNENGTLVEVFFDDFSVEHIHGEVVQVDDYYPFGLVFNSYSRENSVANDYKYNGKELQDGLGLGWLDYGARMYMADIGRWVLLIPFPKKGEDGVRMPTYLTIRSGLLILMECGRISMTFLVKLFKPLKTTSSKKTKQAIVETSKVIVEEAKEFVRNIEVSVYGKAEVKLNAQVGGAAQIKGVGVKGNYKGAELVNLTLGGKVNTKSGELSNLSLFETAGNNGNKENSGGGLEYYVGVSHETETSVNEDGSKNRTTKTSVSGGAPVYGSIQGSVVNENGDVSVTTGYTNGASFGLFLVPSVNVEMGIELKPQIEDEK